MKTLFIFVLCLAPVAHAQTVAPTVAEFHKKANGQFQVRNNTVTPLVVVISMSEFHRENGQQITTPLSSNIHVELNEMSARLAPLSTHTFSYKATCDSLPCGFAFYSRFSGAHVSEGVGVALWVPSSVCICADSVKGCHERVRALLDK